MRCRLRVIVCGAVAAFLGAGCGGESVADHVDALLRSRDRYTHDALRLPGRVAGNDGASLADRLRGNDDGRALLDAGDDAVPDLVRLLDDPDRQTIAAAILAEIGGTTAAQGLLDEWRRVRQDAKRKCIFHVPDVGVTLGSRYQNVNGEFYSELLDALSRTGRDVSAAIADDTEAALAECERMKANGANLTLSEKREEGGRLVELRWQPEPIETAREGLKILAASGAPEAPPLISEALRMPIRAVRRAALRSVPLLGEQAEPLLPELARLLEDPEWSDDAREQLEILADSLPEEQRRAMVRRFEGQFREPATPSR